MYGFCTAHSLKGEKNLKKLMSFEKFHTPIEFLKSFSFKGVPREIDL
jgi:hypothetical protein